MELKRIGAYIDIAIQREEESYALYMDLSTRLQDRSARDALFLLAGEEKQHKAFLERYRDAGMERKRSAWTRPSTTVSPSTWTDLPSIRT